MDVLSRNTALLHQLVEGGAIERVAKRLEPFGVIADECPIEDSPGSALLGGEHFLHDPLEQGDVAADADLEVKVRNLRAPPEKAEHVLWMGEADERGFLQRIDADDLCAAPLCLKQRREHPRMV